MRRVVYTGVILFVILLIIIMAYPTRTTCNFQANFFTISKVDSGTFSLRIPCTGLIAQDSMSENIYVNVQIDELYFSKVITGLKGTTIISGKEHSLEVISVSDTIYSGRFDIKLKFDSTINDLKIGQSLRLRLELDQPSKALLLPLGGFYKDTGGGWIYRIRNGDTAIKQKISLGRKNTEYFEIIEGLKQGDSVITSPYDLFQDKELIYLSDYDEKF